MLIFRDEELGLYHVAEKLAGITKEPRIVWLRRFAKAMHNGELIIPYFELRTKVEGCGLETLEQLAENKIFVETGDTEKRLRTVYLNRDQLIHWLAQNHSIHAVALSPNGERSRPTPEQIVEQERKAGKPAEVIAHILKAEFAELKNKQIGQMLPSKPGANIEDSSHAKRGYRLLKGKD